MMQEVKLSMTSIIHKPWNGQTYDYYNSMITWIKKMDGSWTYDYSVFDRWVEFMMSMGINKEINCYTMIPWKLSFQYFDQATNTMKVVVAHPGDEEYEALWLPFLRDFASHLKAKEWFPITCISMDERPMDVMQKVISIIHKADKDFKISLAGALHSELSDDLYDYCVALRMKYTDEQIQRRKAHSQITKFLYQLRRTSSQLLLHSAHLLRPNGWAGMRQRRDLMAICVGRCSIGSKSLCSIAVLYMGSW